MGDIAAAFGADGPLRRQYQHRVSMWRRIGTTRLKNKKAPRARRAGHVGCKQLCGGIRNRSETADAPEVTTLQRRVYFPVLLWDECNYTGPPA
jgi:hypothetical protein